MIHPSPAALWSGPGVAGAWRWAGPAIMVAAAAAMLGFREPVTAAADTWSRSPSFEHGYAIVLVVAALIWSLRHRLRRELPRPSIAGLILCAAAAALGAVGMAGAMQVVGQVAFVLLLNAIVLAVLGTRVWRVLAFPLLYLLFAVPLGDAIVPLLRELTARAIVLMLGVAGAPAVLDGYLIRLPNADYRVAEACSGLRFLLVSVAAAVLAAHFLMRSWRRRLLFLAIAALMPLIANALRAAILIWLEARGTLDPGSAALHLTYGLGFTGLLLALLMVLAWAMREPPARIHFPALPAMRSAAPAMILLSAAAASALALMPLSGAPRETGAASAPAPLARPGLGGGWAQAVPDAELLQAAAAAGVDASLAAAWERQSSRAELLILFYRQERQGAEAVGGGESGRITLGEVPVRLALGEHEIEATARLEDRGGQRFVSCTWFWVDGTFTASAVGAKLRQIRSRLLGQAAPMARLQLTFTGGEFDRPEEAFATWTSQLQPVGPILERAARDAP